jgi:hypothetical protein
MRPRTLIISFITIVIAFLLVVILTLALIPQQTNPAFAAATQFIEAAGKGQDAAAFALLSPAMQAYVKANCPDGSVSGCLKAYTPPEWGAFQSGVFRRADPDGKYWNVDIIATYAQDKGASGVCIYQRMQQDEAGQWRVYGWAGFIACGDPRSRTMAANSDTPNRAP